MTETGDVADERADAAEAHRLLAGAATPAERGDHDRDLCLVAGADHAGRPGHAGGLPDRHLVADRARTAQETSKTGSPEADPPVAHADRDHDDRAEQDDQG